MKIKEIDGKKIECYEVGEYPYELWDANPNCPHEIEALDSGIKCRKCRGWACY